MKLINKIALLNIELIKPYTDKYDLIVEGLKSGSFIGDTVEAACTAAYAAITGDADCNADYADVADDDINDVDDAYNAYVAAVALAYATSSHDEKFRIAKVIHYAYEIEDTRPQLIELLKGTEYEIN